jgi:hypothetical protein
MMTWVWGVIVFACSFFHGDKNKKNELLFLIHCKVCRLNNWAGISLQQLAKQVSRHIQYTRTVDTYRPSSFICFSHHSLFHFVFAVSVLLVLCFSMWKNWKNVRLEIKPWIFSENEKNDTDIYIVFMKGEQWIGHRFLCALSDIKMGIKTLLAMKDWGICQHKELS